MLPICCAGDAADNDPFNAENRMGLDGTLHRISAIRGRDQLQSITGLTYRIGWHISGVLSLLASAAVSCYFHHSRLHLTFPCTHFPAHHISHLCCNISLLPCSDDWQLLPVADRKCSGWADRFALFAGIADLLLDSLAELQSECSGKLEGVCPSSLLLLGPPGAGQHHSLTSPLPTALPSVTD